ncbi:MAG: anthranilate synthase component I family protein [Desulfatibacillaceae bacterium]
MILSRFPDKNEFIELSKKGNLVPVCVEILGDTQTPVSALAKLDREDGPLFLLESVEGGERWGRYSFLGTDARYKVSVYRDTVEVENRCESESIEHGGDPLAVLRGLMSRFRPVSLPQLPRFWGGMVGYFTHESVSFIEQVDNKLPEDVPLADFLITGDLLIFDNVRHTITLVAHAFLDEEDSPEAGYERASARLSVMLERLGHPTPRRFMAGVQKQARLEPVLKPDDYRNMVREVKHHITEGDVIQCVISQPFRCTAPVDPWGLYRAQRYVNPSPYMYFMRLGETTLVGSSPETMVRLENGVATLRPIAGTRPRGRTEQEDRGLADELLADPKERAEHLMLVDLGRNDLGRAALTGTVQVTDLMVVERYSHVMHLVSNITCDLAGGMDGFDLFRACFPAGTLTGAPKVRAMEIISSLERTARGPYGGAVGYFSFTGNMDLAITIRTATIRDGQLTVQAGAGIVADSDPEREREETVNKAMSIQRAIELINQGS